MWYAKMYFSGEKEFFENDAFGMQGAAVQSSWNFRFWKVC